MAAASVASVVRRGRPWLSSCFTQAIGWNPQRLQFAALLHQSAAGAAGVAGRGRCGAAKRDAAAGASLATGRL
eukprot:SAG25_NODE_79_length_16803_cov_43.538194_20_plen_73_part_00